MKKSFNYLFDVFSILGCVLGAGFISGTEIKNFFVRFGLYGFIGIVLSSILFFFIIIYSTKKVCNLNDKLLKKSKIQQLLTFCQVFISAAMMAGIVELLGASIGITASYVVVFILLFVVLLLGLNFAKSVNVFVCALAILILPIILMVANSNFNFENFNLTTNIAYLPISVVYAVFYIAMNTAASMPIINSISSKPKNKNWKLALGVSGILFVLLLAFFCVISASSSKLIMPIQGIIGNGVVLFIYNILFLIAMLSTLLSTTNGLKKVFVKFENNAIECFLVTVLVCIVSFIGFENIIKFVYPVIGCFITLGYLCDIVKYIWQYYRNKKNIKHQNIIKIQ